MAKRPQIIILSGEMAGKRFDVREGGVRLGRSSSNDIHIPDEELSRNHCLFEQDGADAIRIVDLASANGTFVNGEQLGADAAVLKVGDIIEAGRSVLRVVAEGAPDETPERTLAPTPGAIDLGLAGDQAASADASPAPGRKSTARSSILWGVAALVVVCAIAAMLLVPSAATYAPRPADGGGRMPAKTSGGVTELRYEKIDANSSHIFRFAMEVDGDGLMRVTCDDVPGEQRHIEKKKQLTKEEKAHLAKIFDDEGWLALDRSYSGSSAMDENRLESYRICTIGGGGARETCVENTVEPEAFRRVREALEAFSRNELGIWALQYSREELLKLVKASEDLGDSRWEERDVRYGNISDAVAAYREAVFYLDTLEPKPDGYRALKEKLETAVAELDRRYRDQRFAADRAINLSDWDAARRELRTLLDIVADTDDPRHTEAKAKLVDVEKRLSRKKGRN